MRYQEPNIPRITARVWEDLVNEFFKRQNNRLKVRSRLKLLTRLLTTLGRTPLVPRFGGQSLETLVPAARFVPREREGRFW